MIRVGIVAVGMDSVLSLWNTNKNDVNFFTTVQNSPANKGPNIIT